MLSRHRAPRSFIILVSLVLSLLLAACGGGGTSGSPTPTPSPAHASTSTTSSSPTAATPTSGSSGFPTGTRTYSGNGYTISYPADWTVSGTKTAVAFNGATCSCTFQINIAPNPGGVVSPSTADQGGVTAGEQGLKNAHNINVPSTVSIGGDSWDQKSFGGSVSQSGQDINVQFVVASDNHPASSPSTQIFTVVYGTAAQLFSTANTTFFQPMLQSFKFTS
jgi:hypothetical protein